MSAELSRVSTRQIDQQMESEQLKGSFRRWRPVEAGRAGKFDELIELVMESLAQQAAAETTG